MHKLYKLAWNNFFNMKSETIIISDIKLFSKKIAEENNANCCSLLGNAELKNANLVNIRTL